MGPPVRVYAQPQQMVFLVLVPTATQTNKVDFFSFSSHSLSLFPPSIPLSIQATGYQQPPEVALGRLIHGEKKSKCVVLVPRFSRQMHENLSAPAWAEEGRRLHPNPPSWEALW